jgi:hypothetical protein
VRQLDILLSEKLVFKFVTADSKTDAQTTKSQSEIKFVKEKGKIDLFVSAMIIGFYGWFSGIFLSIYLIALYPPISEQAIAVYVIWFSLPIALAIVAFYRNKLLRRSLEKNGHERYLHLAYDWRKMVFILTAILIILYYIMGLQDSKFTTLSFFSFFFLMSLYMIFENPLTEEGEITILFELLEPPITNFHNAREYWEKVARKIQDKMRRANIQLSSKDLVFHFSKNLLVTNGDISNDLISIRDWLLGRQRSCFDGLWRLNQKIKLEQCKRNFMLEWFYQNPDKLVKYGFAVIVLGIAIAVAPSTITTILQYLGL